MKETLLLLSAILLTLPAWSQTTSGTVVYEESITMKAPDDLPAEAGPLAEFFSNGLHFKKILRFNSEASTYKNEKQDKKETKGSAEDGMQVMFHMEVPEEITYTDLKTGNTVEQRDLMGKRFLVSGEGTKRAWKMTGQQKTILNFPCQQAISYGKDTVIAWFTTSIPVSAGPQEWRGLPGLILEATQGGREGGGSFTITAKEFMEGNTDKISPPKEGKKVTKEEFEAIQKEKQKEMEQQFGGASGGNGRRVMINIER